PPPATSVRAPTSARRRETSRCRARCRHPRDAARSPASRRLAESPRTARPERLETVRASGSRADSPGRPRRRARARRVPAGTSGIVSPCQLVQMVLQDDGRGRGIETFLARPPVLVALGEPAFGFYARQPLVL